jgi:cellulose synthase/poly-beta-1,6-N-acetylglucosamine synthase-like glycosyltransferase
MGNALRDRQDFFGETDTVYGGCFLRSQLIEIGMYDETMVKNEDDELSFRLRKAGGKIIQSGEIRVKYYPRKKFSDLFKQFLQYGYWKIPVLRKHPRQGSIRHLLPSALVILLLAFPAAALLFPWISPVCFMAFWSAYLLTILSESLRVNGPQSWTLFPATTLAIALIHIGYGTGCLLGLISSLVNVRWIWFEKLTR